MNRQQARDRLAALPTWRLMWALIMPIGFLAFWLGWSVVQESQGGEIVFGVLLAMAVAIVGMSLWIKGGRRRHTPSPDSNRETIA